jgi:hypothetical protein
MILRHSAVQCIDYFPRLTTLQLTVAGVSDRKAIPKLQNADPGCGHH